MNQTANAVISLLPQDTTIYHRLVFNQLQAGVIPLDSETAAWEEKNLIEQEWLRSSHYYCSLFLVFHMHIYEVYALVCTASLKSCNTLYYIYLQQETKFMSHFLC